MSVDLLSLWPSIDEIGRIDFVAPVVIMREQAEAISRLTKNVIEGQVINEKVYSSRPNPLAPSSLAGRLSPFSEPATIQTQDFSKLRYAFLLHAVALDGAKVRLFTVTHDVELVYPLKFSGLSKSHERFLLVQVNSEEEFEDILRSFFHSEEVIKVLQSLIAQSGGIDESE